MKPTTRTTILRIVALVFVLGLSVGLYLLRDRVRELEGLGYTGIFLVSLFSSATIILPVPGVLFTSMMAAVFNPFWVAIAAGSGAALGELSGYLAGFSGRGVAEKTKLYYKMENWMRRFGAVTILVFAFIPNPVFDMAGMVAGALKMPLWKFLLWCWVGKIGKMMLFAYGGVTIMGWFQ
jgi:membrane protein YqaA with SNARE-associated domain